MMIHFVAGLPGFSLAGSLLVMPHIVQRAASPGQWGAPVRVVSCAHPARGHYRGSGADTRAAPAHSESLTTPAVRAMEEPAVLFAADYPFMDVFWTMLIFFFWVIWIWILVTVLIDLFRRHDISGWGKAAWALFVIVLPYLGVFIYLITQGKSMAERRADEIRASQAQFDDHVRSVAASDPGDQIAKAKELLDSGAIDQAEFDQLKAQGARRAPTSVLLSDRRRS